MTTSSHKHTIESHCEHCGLTTLGKVHGECSRCGRTFHSRRQVVTPEFAEARERQEKAARIAKVELNRQRRQRLAKSIRRLIREGWYGFRYYKTLEQRRAQARKLLGR